MTKTEQDYNLQIWLNAMRSGDYEQCIGAYVKKYRNAPDQHDPIGVARDVFRQVTGEEQVAHTVGLPVCLIKEVVELSDSGHSWDELCDFIEEHQC